ncbi:MAG: long-chain fatty acid--CoA ligase [Candidatus Solibacter sp.]|nr:long-chain fatty acid--CoA ligase [Candidatus Solibacter sp.]
MRKLAANLDPSRRTVYNMLVAAAETHGFEPALHQPDGNGGYRSYSWAEYRQLVEEIAAGLRAIGLQAGGTVALASETRAEFYLADLGIMTAGCIAAGVYTSLSHADQARTLLASSPKAVFFESPKTMAALDAAGTAAFEGRRILLTGEAGGALTLEQLRKRGREAMAVHPHFVARFTSGIQPSHHCILYLTSGATGEPKMGLVTHNAVCANCDMGPAVLPEECLESGLAFLPSANITQRLGMELLMIRMGVQVYFSEGLSKLPVEMRTVKPTFFIAPPRVWERMYASITAEIRKKPAVIRKLFYIGLGVGQEISRAREQGREPSPFARTSYRFFDRVIFSKVRERLGGRIKLAVSGAAPLARGLADFFTAIGLPLVEGYGLTEGGVVCLNPFDHPMPGSIGKPLPGVEFRTSADGELLIRAETLFDGYFNDPEATAAVLREGWLHTGDLAEIGADGYVRITGRKKELIVSSNGKKIYPSRIESLFKLEPLIGQVLLVGDRLPYVAALLTLNPAAADAIAGLEKTAEQTTAGLAGSAAAQAEVKRIIQRVNKQLAPFEQIRRFRILEREFSVETGELTPTMKLRRKVVLENFREDVEQLYAGREDLD